MDGKSQDRAVVAVRSWGVSAGLQREAGRVVSSLSLYVTPPGSLQDKACFVQKNVTSAATSPLPH
jgi:hypothetical protein